MVTLTNVTSYDFFIYILRNYTSIGDIGSVSFTDVTVDVMQCYNAIYGTPCFFFHPLTTFITLEVTRFSFTNNTGLVYFNKQGELGLSLQFDTFSVSGSQFSQSFLDISINEAPNIYSYSNFSFTKFVCLFS